jgi:hypothetical protein
MTYSNNILLFLTFLVLVFCCPNSVLAQKKSAKQATQAISLEGTFVSTSGVMTPLSCYCGNGGKLTTAKNEEIKLCFDDMKQNKEQDLAACKTIKVKGYYIEKANNPEPTNPCPKGVMRYFKVISVTCL